MSLPGTRQAALPRSPPSENLNDLGTQLLSNPNFRPYACCSFILLSWFKFTNSKWPSEILGLPLHTSKDPNSRSLSLSATLAQSSPCCLVSMPCEYYHALFYLSSLMIVPEVCLASIIRCSRDSPAKSLALSGGCHSQCRPGEGLWCC